MRLAFVQAGSAYDAVSELLWALVANELCFVAAQPAMMAASVVPGMQIETSCVLLSQLQGMKQVLLAVFAGSSRVASRRTASSEQGRLEVLLPAKRLTEKATQRSLKN